MAVVADRRAEIDSRATSGVRSDQVLAELRPGLELLGYRVEVSKRRTDTVRRPVLFGDQGAEVVTYEVDAVHDELGILVEIEAGRGAMSNAVYRDLVHASLIVDARYLALGVMSEYRYTGGTAKSYRDARDLCMRSTEADGWSFPSKVCCSSATDRSPRIDLGTR